MSQFLEREDIREVFALAGALGPEEQGKARERRQEAWKNLDLSKLTYALFDPLPKGKEQQ